MQGRAGSGNCKFCCQQEDDYSDDKASRSDPTEQQLLNRNSIPMPGSYEHDVVHWSPRAFRCRVSHRRSARGVSSDHLCCMAGHFRSFLGRRCAWNPPVGAGCELYVKGNRIPSALSVSGRCCQIDAHPVSVLSVSAFDALCSWRRLFA
jgi:hypothetical protein